MRNKYQILNLQCGCGRAESNCHTRLGHVVTVQTSRDFCVPDSHGRGTIEWGRNILLCIYVFF